ncbi:Uncharacterised protein [Burkholderia pseudomallei]|uniref:Uncharacterized protein n=4 Tax=Burkholderia pseudomallei TaxID=28450 RepID=A0A069B256_BURPE|nr:hypothetical protein BURPS1710b_2545 [Burkholderia pseudomallei 1710b]ABN89327.1 conserved hypothetical protein [Burkholderia pseudomallei 1106a]ACQ97713.1 conserved hypothetical protein [Burkholderia pseudomallei MSHR346]AFR16362.1 hypothetical protein BPC006_I2495 [Burkholderia pseudomallei BPC006]AIO14647.1 hypothetical protein DP58_2891 [Burkholderia pseudomallei]AIP21046.1 hypothetical protein DP63_2029 [Burkholderia pseudomallei MSHR5855]AIP38839.1 hypothetical protein DP65_3137 [Bur
MKEQRLNWTPLSAFDHLFSSRHTAGANLNFRQNAPQIGQWLASIGLNRCGNASDIRAAF